MSTRHPAFDKLLKFIFFALIIIYPSSLGVEKGFNLPPCPGNKITSALVDSSGVLWASTQGQGLFYLKLGENVWKKAGGKNMSGNFPSTENFYALAEDAQGRIWVGTDHWGVCIWNGKRWEKYTHKTTLPGERVFGMSVSPITGDVSIATSGGIAIYFPATDSWRSITRSDGLPEDQISDVAFDASGDLWAGFSSSGIARIRLRDGYKIGELVKSNSQTDKTRNFSQAPSFLGSGLPSNLSNTLTVHDNSVFVGTTLGLGIRRGNKQIFIRGMDAIEKFKERGIMISSSQGKIRLLPEDYITSLHSVKEGIWIGFRNQGAVLFNPVNMQYKSVKDNELTGKKKGGTISCFVNLPDGTVLAGVFGEGFRSVGKTMTSKTARRRLENEIKHPKILSDLDSQEWRNSVKQFQSLPKRVRPYGICFANDDWSTQGDWCNRYGRHFSLRCSGEKSLGGIMHRFDLKKDKGGFLYDARVILGPKKKIKEVWISKSFHEESE